jgi:hypothetical protein
MSLEKDAKALAHVAGVAPGSDTIIEACALYYAAQARVKALTAEREELRINMGFAATLLRNAVTAVGQKQKKFGSYTVHIGDGYDVFCMGCGTLASQCGCAGGPSQVSAIYKPRIWITK